MKSFMVMLLLIYATCANAEWPDFRGAVEVDQVGQVDMDSAPPRIMGLYEQGFQEGAKIGDQNAGKFGWFFAGFGNVPLLWLPWTVEPRRPAKPPIQAEAEFNSGWKNGYRAGWKNAHKAYYIAGTIVSSAAIATVIATSE
ncbi:hypothetical protein KKC97_04110 [bacterium]|nr:hypothetical protein [bacterium]MBU1636830.1 hypothetical protein [bacterium]